jgi:hypothetical protein
MARMIEDNVFRASFEAFAQKCGHGISAGTDEYGDDTVETRDEVSDFIAVAGTEVLADKEIDGKRFVEMLRGGKHIIVADHGDARLCYVA